jgi:hypothetical protein
VQIRRSGSPSSMSGNLKIVGLKTLVLHNILEPTTGVTFFNSGFSSDPT